LLWAGNPAWAVSVRIIASSGSHAHHFAGNKTGPSLVYAYERSKPTKQRRQAGQFKGETKMRENLIGNSNSNSNSNTWKNIRRFTAKTALAMTLAITAMGIAATLTAGTAQAGGNSSKNTESPANLVGHVTITGNVTRMLLVKRNGKEYLMLGLDSSAQVAMLDVSDPRRPQSMAPGAPAPGKPSTEINVVADTLTAFGKSETATPASADPKEIRSLNGVTSFLVDNAHGLIYAANNDGLWIVKTKRQAADDARPDYYGG
jgi:hypothetical protein